MYRSYPLCPSNFQTHSNQSSLFSPFYNLGSNQRCVYMVSVESCTVARAPTSGHTSKGKWLFPSRSHRLQVAGRWVPCEPAPPPHSFLYDIFLCWYPSEFSLYFLLRQSFKVSAFKACKAYTSNPESASKMSVLATLTTTAGCVSVQQNWT